MRRMISQDRPDWKRLERHPLEQRVVAVQLGAPLLVVVGDVFRRRGGPAAAGALSRHRRLRWPARRRLADDLAGAFAVTLAGRLRAQPGDELVAGAQLLAEPVEQQVGLGEAVAAHATGRRTAATPPGRCPLGRQLPHPLVADRGRDLLPGGQQRGDEEEHRGHHRNGQQRVQPDRQHPTIVSCATPGTPAAGVREQPRSTGRKWPKFATCQLSASRPVVDCSA